MFFFAERCERVTDHMGVFHSILGDSHQRCQHVFVGSVDPLDPIVTRKLADQWDPVNSKVRAVFQLPLNVGQAQCSLRARSFCPARLCSTNFLAMIQCCVFLSSVFLCTLW